MQLKKLGQSGEPNKSVRRSGVKAGVSLLTGQEGGGRGGGGGGGGTMTIISFRMLAEQ